MIDDVGTKVPIHVVDERLEPSLRVITSPGNEQWWYLFGDSVTDPDLFTRLIKAFIEQRMGGKDPGMGGINRVGRIPPAINGKKKYRAEDNSPFVVSLAAPFAPERQYRLEEIATAFDLTLAAKTRMREPTQGVSELQRMEREADFNDLRNDLERLGLIIKRHANVSGRIPILCPWYQQHTGASRSGTYLVEPNERNRYAGSFVCFHSTTHRDDNHLNDLRGWVWDAIEARDRLSSRAVNLRPFRIEDIQE